MLRKNYKLFTLSSISLFILLNLSFGTDLSEKKTKNDISDVIVRDMSGNEVAISEFKGKVLLIVNVASKCGYTYQYEGLQKLYEEFKDQGLEILAFPCNDFGGQEPGTKDEIREFCTSNYGVTFKLFDKIRVKGDSAEPLYKILTDNDVTGKSDIKWNFEKFIISKEGKIVSRFPSSVKPYSDELVGILKEELDK